MSITLIHTRPRVAGKPPGSLDLPVGVQALWLPAFELSPLPGARQTIQDWLAQAHETGLVCFVSPGALTLTRDAFPNPWPPHLAVGVMGVGSASAAQRLGIPHEVLVFPQPAQGDAEDSEGFLMSLDRAMMHETPLHSIASMDMRALVVKGPRGREVLHDGLSARGWNCQRVQGYERTPLVWSDHERHRLMQVCDESTVLWSITSSEAVDVIVHQLKALPEQTRTRLLSSGVQVTHPRMAQACEKAGFTDICLTRPGAAALEAFLQQRCNVGPQP